MLRLLDILWLKNSRPFFSKLVRVKASNLYTLLIGIIKPYHYYYMYFLLRSLVSEIFAGLFYQAKAVSSSFTNARIFREIKSQDRKFPDRMFQDGKFWDKKIPGISIFHGIQEIFYEKIPGFFL